MDKAEDMLKQPQITCIQKIKFTLCHMETRDFVTVKTLVDIEPINFISEWKRTILILQGSLLLGVILGGAS